MNMNDFENPIENNDSIYEGAEAEKTGNVSADPAERGERIAENERPCGRGEGTAEECRKWGRGPGHCPGAYGGPGRPAEWRGPFGGFGPEGGPGRRPGPRPCPPGMDRGEGFPHGRGPGPVPPPHFRHRPAVAPDFEPEAERREHYAGLSRRDKITFQLKALGHILRMMPETRDGQNRVLSILTEKGTLSQRELTELADIRSASMSEMVMKLEMNGYVRRFPNPRDHRSLCVSLTEAGAVAARALAENRTDLYEGMDEEELERLLATLEKLGDRWRTMLPGAAARRAPFNDKVKT